jgi:hypothetical protein
VPLTDLSRTDSWDDLDGQRRRLKLFCDAYGGLDLLDVLDSAAKRLQMLVETMREFAENGHGAFAGHIADGHDQTYLADARHISSKTKQNWLAHSPPVPLINIVISEQVAEDLIQRTLGHNDASDGLPSQPLFEHEVERAAGNQWGCANVEPS